MLFFLSIVNSTSYILGYKTLISINSEIKGKHTSLLFKKERKNLLFSNKKIKKIIAIKKKNQFAI
jgi:hypothetical protein